MRHSQAAAGGCACGSSLRRRCAMAEPAARIAADDCLPEIRPSCLAVKVKLRRRGSRSRARRAPPKATVASNARYGPKTLASGLSARRSHHEFIRLLRCAKKTALLSMVSMRLRVAMAQRDILRDELQRGKRLFVLSRLKAANRSPRRSGWRASGSRRNSERRRQRMIRIAITPPPKTPSARRCPRTRLWGPSIVRTANASSSSRRPSLTV